MLTRRRAIAATFLTAALALSGCAQGTPDTAAIVNGVVITEKSVAAQAAALSAINGQAPGSLHGIVVEMAVKGELANQLAAKHRITITQADRDAIINSPQLQAIGADPKAAPVVTNLANFAIIEEKMEASDFVSDMAEAKITPNPRYGRWDAVHHMLTVNADTGDTGSLSLPGALTTPR